MTAGSNAPTTVCHSQRTTLHVIRRYSYSDLLYCLSDPALLGCELKLEMEEIMPTTLRGQYTTTPDNITSLKMAGDELRQRSWIQPSRTSVCPAVSSDEWPRTGRIEVVDLSARVCVPQGEFTSGWGPCGRLPWEPWEPNSLTGRLAESSLDLHPLSVLTEMPASARLGHTYTFVVISVNTLETHHTNWDNISYLRMRVQHTKDELPLDCYTAGAGVMVYINGECAAWPSIGPVNPAGEFLFTVPAGVISDLVTSVDLPPAELDLVFTFNTDCFGDVTGAVATAFSIIPFQYHAPSNCMGFQDCSSCLSAGCNWCEWSCDANCDSLPEWIPDYSWTEEAHSSGKGRCGIHPYLCRETLGAFNTCRATLGGVKDILWPITFFIIPIALLYAIVQIRNKTW